MNHWADKRVVITGASSGLGRTLAEEVAKCGGRLVLVARNQRRLSDVCQLVEHHARQIVIVPADVTAEADRDRIVAEVDEQLGGLDLICHCAGRSMRAEILSTPAEAHRELWELNFLAAVELTRLLSPHLTCSGGHVVLIGSLASKVAPRYLGAYPASKFPLAAFAQQLRLQWGKDGPHVLLVCPGPIAHTHAHRRYESQSGDLPPDAARAGGGAKVQAIDPRELAARILRACERRQAELIVPRKARLLFIISQISPRLGDWLLRKTTAT